MARMMDAQRVEKYSWEQMLGGRGGVGNLVGAWKVSVREEWSVWVGIDGTDVGGRCGREA